MSSILQAVQQSLEVIHYSYSTNETAILLADTEKVLSFLPSKVLDIYVERGTSMKDLKGTITEKTLQKGERLTEERGPEQFGVAYLATGTPIRENGRVVGVLTVVASNDQMNKLKEISSELALTVGEMSATTDDVASSSLDVNKQIQDLSSESRTVVMELEKIGAIVSSVQKIANQANLLGLNAGIEAARVGEHGRGFTIVANEIRKMAEQSKQFSDDIQSQLAKIKGYIEKMNSTIQQIAENSEQNSVSIKELRTAFERISSTAVEMLDAAQIK